MTRCGKSKSVGGWTDASAGKVTPARSYVRPTNASPLRAGELALQLRGWWAEHLVKELHVIDVERLR